MNTEVDVSGLSGFNPSFASVPSGFDPVPVPTGTDLVPLLIQNADLPAEWELGLYSTDGLGISRGGGADRVLASSNSGSPVNFTAGSNKNVLLVNPAFFALAENYHYTNTSSPPRLRSLFGVDIPSGYTAFPILETVAAVRGIYCAGGGHEEAGLSRVQTTDDASTQLVSATLDVAGAASLRVDVVATESSGTAPFDSKHVAVVAAAVNNGSGVALVGSPSITVIGEAAGLSAATVSVDVSGSSVRVMVAGIAATTIEWVAKASITFVDR